MANVTKYGVSYDFSNPAYEIDLEGIVFRFSSKPHLERFKALATSHMRGVSSSLTRRFHMAVDADVVGLFQFYRQVETRGFHVTIDGVTYRSPDFLHFKVVIDDAAL